MSSFFHMILSSISSTPSPLWRRQICLIYDPTLTKTSTKLCSLLVNSLMDWSVQFCEETDRTNERHGKNKGDSEVARDKQSNNTALGGLCFLMLVTGSDKGNNGMKKGWQDGAYQLHPKVLTEIAALHSLSRWGQTLVNQDVGLFEQLETHKNQMPKCTNTNISTNRQ